MADRHDLLQRFMPILYFRADEAWAPAAVEGFLQLARHERQTARGVWTRTITPLPTSSVGCTFTPCYRLNLLCALKAGATCYEKAAATLSDWKHPVIYGRVLDVPAATPMPAGISGKARYLVRYWLFYSFDDWRSRGERLWQAHEGDWETITVALAANTNPIFAAYSQHCSGTVRAWSKVTRMQTHPIDYVALGSHANYFTQTSSPTQSSAASTRTSQRGPLESTKARERRPERHHLAPALLTRWTRPPTSRHRYNSSTWTPQCPPRAASPAAGAKASSSGSAGHQPASHASAAASDPRHRAGTPHPCRRLAHRFKLKPTHTSPVARRSHTETHGAPGAHSSKPTTDGHPARVLFPPEAGLGRTDLLVREHARAPIASFAFHGTRPRHRSRPKTKTLEISRFKILARQRTRQSGSRVRAFELLTLPG